MNDTKLAGAQAAVTAGDAKAIIRSIVATGIGLATLLLMLIGLMLQQNAALNTRFDHLNASVNARFDDSNASVNARFASVNARFDDFSVSVNAHFDDMNARIEGIQNDIRELRALVIDAIKRTNPAD